MFEFPHVTQIDQITEVIVFRISVVMLHFFGGRAICLFSLLSLLKSLCSLLLSQILPLLPSSLTLPVL